MQPWVRYGLMGGVIAGASTLTANLVIVLLRPADLCHAGPVSLVLLSLGAIIILIWMGAAAGFATARRVGSVAQATLSGVLVGVIAGCALLALIPFAATASHRQEELTAQCPGGGSVSFGGSFNFGTPPPASSSRRRRQVSLRPRHLPGCSRHRRPVSPVPCLPRSARWSRSASASASRQAPLPWPAWPA